MPFKIPSLNLYALISQDGVTRNPFEPITEIRNVRIHNFSDAERKTINKYSIQKKFVTYEDIFYYVKCLVEILDSKVYDFKNKTAINADYYDVMFVMTKRIKEALIDAYNEYMTLLEKENLKK